MNVLRMMLVGWFVLAGLGCPGVAAEENPEGGGEGSDPAVRTDADVDGSSEETEQKAGEGMSRNEALLAGLTIFVLAVFVGFEIITKVPPTLHTPLMSGSNAISGITLVGAVIVAGKALNVSGFLGMIAVVLASINAVGGFLVTHRMLAMFKKR